MEIKALSQQQPQHEFVLEEFNVQNVNNVEKHKSMVKMCVVPFYMCVCMCMCICMYMYALCTCAIVELGVENAANQITC